MTEQDEGRLARWSRLKTTGGASEAENSATPDVDSLQSDESSPSREVPIGFEDLPDPANLPGGIQARNFVPPMTALADPEKSEEEGSLLEAPVFDGTEPNKEFGSDASERELTQEEQEAVGALPPLERLDKDSDFTPFLADNIPDFIRNRALKILWRSDPLFGFQDGLDDYAENFRVIDKLIDAATQSSYKPGQGYDQPEKVDADEDVETADAVETTELTETSNAQSDDESSAASSESTATSNESTEDDFPQVDQNTAGPESEPDSGGQGRVAHASKLKKLPAKNITK